MKIQSKTIILLLLLIVSLISLLSYFFFTKYKFLLEYIDNRIDMKSNKLIEKYSLENLNAATKQKEHNYFNNLKDNLENFNNTLSNTSFTDHLAPLSDIDEEEENYSDEEIKNIDNWYQNVEKQVEEQSEEQSEEQLDETESLKEQVEEQVEEHLTLDMQELPNLANIDDNVDEYIKQILESKDIDTSEFKITEELEKKK